MQDYIPLEQIISIEIAVSEKIDDKNLKDFVLTSLKLNNKDYNKNDLIYATYIEELNQYQIIIINNQYRQGTFQVFELFYEKKSKGIDLYLADDFFCLYKNGTFYYYQTIEFILKIEEFLEFINKKFNTEINNYKRIEKTYFEELRNKYSLRNEKTSIKNINTKNNNSFKFYIIYLFLLISLSSYFYTNQHNLTKIKNSIDNNALELEKFKKERLFVSFENDFEKILENIKKYDLNLLLLEYKENSVKIILTTTIKENLYLFLDEYKKGLISSSVNFDENKKTFETIIHVNLSK